VSFPALEELSPELLAFFFGLFTWGITALGSAALFLMKGTPKKIN
jgi:hypothetical protein